jgi:hypothetical protein
MTLPRIYALINHWKDFPPAYIAMSHAWFKRNEVSEDNGDGDGDIAKIMTLPGVAGGWIGPPAFLPSDVIRMAKEAEGRGNDS